MVSVRQAMCPLCEASCGLEVEMEADNIVRIRGDAKDPFSQGYVCPKAVALQDIQSDRDRIRAPLRREGNRWREIGWEEALKEIAERFSEIQKKHGNDAVGVYVGNPTAHDYATVLFGPLVLAMLKTRSFFSSNSVDGLPRLVASYLEYGSPLTIPVPDIERTDYLLILGANPVVSNGSLMTAPDCKRRLSAIRERGGRIVVVDPRRTETAELADEHHFIRPGGDAYLLAAMVRTVLEERPGVVRSGSLAELVDGADKVAQAVAPFSPERVAGAVGMPAVRIRELARAFMSARTAAAYGRIGTCTQEFGTLATWLIDVLNAVTGNLDRPGGSMFATPSADLIGLAAKHGVKSGMMGFDRWRSRVNGLPEMNGEVPVAAMADEILTPGPGQVRALLTHAGNPVLSLPNGRKLGRALEGLEFMVSIDIYKNETTRHAHLLLPTSFGLEHDHYGLLTNMFSVRSFAKYAAPVVKKPEKVRDSWEVMLDLAMRIWSKRSLSGRLLAPAAFRMLRRFGPRGLLKLMLRFGPHKLALKKLEATPEGLDLGPLEPRLGDLTKQSGRRVDLAPEPLLKDLGRLDARLGEIAEIGEIGESGETKNGAPLLLIGRRHLRSNNSWMHNSLRLVKGKDRCTLIMHPDDAAARSIGNGERVRIESRVGAIEVEAELSDEIMRGVVSLPHGWGHDREGAELEVARRHAGASINDLTDEVLVDALSGCTSFSNVRVRCSPVAVKQQAS